jgi:hypothetical protein
MNPQTSLDEAFKLLELTSCCNAIDDAETDAQRRWARQKYLKVLRLDPETAAYHGFTERGREFPTFATWGE